MVIRLYRTNSEFLNSGKYISTKYRLMISFNQISFEMMYSNEFVLFVDISGKGKRPNKPVRHIFFWGGASKGDLIAI